MARPPGDLLALRLSDPLLAPAAERRLRSLLPAVSSLASGWIVGSAAAGLAASGRATTFVCEGSGDPSSPGDSTFVRIDAEGTATAVRSAGGATPLAVYRDGDIAVISTRLDWLVRYVIADPHIDALAVAMWTSGMPYLPDGRLFVRGVRSVSPGTAATIARDTVTIDRWWRPPPSPRRPASRTAVRERDERFRTLVLDGLARDLDDERANLLTLSGGADSSTLAILAASLGKPVAALTLLTGSAEERAREQRIIDEVTARVSFHTHDRIDANKEQSALTRGPLPVAFPVIHPALLALPRVVANSNPATLAGGEFADEWWGRFAMPDWIESTSALNAARAALKGPSDWKDPLRWARARMRGAWALPAALPTFVRPAVQEEYREWRDRRMRTARDGSWRPLSIRIEMFEPVAAMNWEACAPLGIRRVFPFMSRELLDLTFESHPSEFLGPGFKTRQRRVFRDLVPPSVLDRPKAPFSSVDPDPVPAPDPDRIETIVDPATALPVAAQAVDAFARALESALAHGEPITGVRNV